MRVRVTRGAAARLEAPEDLRRFGLVAEGGLEGEALARALGTAGRLEGGHAWILPDWLRSASGRAGDPEWQAGFARMVEFAAKQGWVDAAGAIRAHIEHDPA
jgi:hypothetical protein